jgi:hypothetical protein
MKNINGCQLDSLGHIQMLQERAYFLMGQSEIRLLINSAFLMQ